jgi:hypothetical protein
MQRWFHYTGNLWLPDHGNENSNAWGVQSIFDALSWRLHGRIGISGVGPMHRSDFGDGPTVPVDMILLGISRTDIVRAGFNYKF